LVLRFFSPVLPKGWAPNEGSMRTIYVESWARVRRLSLSGRILVWVVDRFLVQWEGLEGVGGGKGEFIGVLV
jgi:beta-1,4-N-acetylglucosaminyltransferase